MDFIRRGLTICNVVVIVNDSIVVKNEEVFNIVGRNLAKLIKYRFLKEINEKLEKIQW